MTLYLDTSALVKLYLVEEHSLSVRSMAASANTRATSVISYVEARSAFARRRRERSYSLRVEHETVNEFNVGWNMLKLVEVTESLVRIAGDLASRHALRAYDAIHLASALELQAKLGRPVIFAAFDMLLNRAAKQAGLQLMAAAKRR